VTTELLLQEFHRIPDEPNSIECLRQFVFALAMRGRLSAPDLAGVRAPADHRPPAHLQKTRIEPYQLPREWRWSTTAEVGTARLGKMLDKAKNRGTPRRYLRNINVRWFGFDLSDVKVMPFEDAELSEFELRAGDVLICEGGEPGRAAVWDARGSDVYFQKAVHRVRLNPEVLPLFLVYYLKSASYEGRLAPHATGATFQHLTGKGLATLPAPVPPIDEQHRIVAKVDALMALCDELEAAQAEREARRDRLRTTSLRNLVAPKEPKENARFFLRHSARMIIRPEHVAGVRQAITDLAVRGRLLPQDPRDEPASGFLGNRALPVGPNARTPHGWCWTSLGRLGRVLGGGTPSKSQPEYWGGDIPWVTPKDMKRDRIANSIDHISEAALAGSAVKLIRTGSLLMVVRGMILAHSFPTALTIAPVTINQDMKALEPFDRRLAEMLLLLTKGRRVTSLGFVERSTHGTGRLATHDVFDLPLPLPPLAEQHRILAKVSELMAVCDELEQGLATEQTERGRLLEALLRYALEAALPAREREPLGAR